MVGGWFRKVVGEGEDFSMPEREGAGGRREGGGESQTAFPDRLCGVSVATGCNIIRRRAASVGASVFSSLQQDGRPAEQRWRCHRESVLT